MMTVNLNIKANVNSISLSQIYELLNYFSKSEKKENEIIFFKGFKFQIETNIDMSINYVITEIL
jgi:hypothetical protein